MAAAVAWVLNLDADFELGNVGAWSPPRDLIERVELVSKHAEHLLGPDDVLIREGAEVPPGTIGRAWCPTPSALARLQDAGATPGPAPSFEILRKVNDRSFNASLGQTLPGAAYVVDLASVRRVVGSAAGVGRARRRLCQRRVILARRSARGVVRHLTTSHMRLARLAASVGFAEGGSRWERERDGLCAAGCSGAAAPVSHAAAVRDATPRRRLLESNP